MKLLFLITDQLQNLIHQAKSLEILEKLGQYFAKKGFHNK